MRQLLVRSTILAGGLSLLLSGGASAYFEFELVNGGTVLADSYVEQGDKLHLYRGSGELDLDKSRVKAIRERDGSVPDASKPVASVPAAAPAPAPAPKPARPSGVNDAASVVIPEDGTPAEIEEALTKKLILSNRDLLFARNGGEDEKSLERRRKEIERIQKQREAVQKKMNP